MSNETVEAEGGGRPMPAIVKKGLISVQGGQMYLKAPYRVLWMREEHPDWGIITTIEHADYVQGFAVVKAVILDGEGRVMATAHSEESRGKLPYLKKAETGAIARALGLCGYGTQFGELDDEDFADAPQNAPRKAQGANSHQGGQTRTATNAPVAPNGQPLNDTGVQCPACHAPNLKPHQKGCKAVGAVV